VDHGVFDNQTQQINVALSLSVGRINAYVLLGRSTRIAGKNCQCSPSAIGTRN
jgi:sulfite exporter TauE/SafE